MGSCEAKKMKEDGFATTLIPIDKIKPPLFQCRTQTLDENLDELVESIKTVGLLEPLTIRIDKDNESELVIGSRRLKACKKVELSVVPCVVRELTDEQALEIEGCENLNRNDLSPEEKTRLVSEWAKLGYDANGIAGKVHKSYTWVTSFLPSEFKDSKKAEAGKLGGEAKSATISVAKQDLSNLTLCEGCKTSRSGVAPWHGRLSLCPDCMKNANATPEVFEHVASIKNGEAKVLAEKHVPKEMKPRDFDKYEVTEALMHPQHSKMEFDMLEIFSQDDQLRP